MQVEQTRAEFLIEQYGHRCRPHLVYDPGEKTIDLLTVKRKLIRWIPAIRRNIIKSGFCPTCGTDTPFHLDHMNPWRPYVLFCLSEDEYDKSDGEHIWVSKNIVRALYNDPENLWWICSQCNHAKSDDVYGTDVVRMMDQAWRPSDFHDIAGPIRDPNTLRGLLEDVTPESEQDEEPDEFLA